MRSLVLALVLALALAAPLVAQSSALDAAWASTLSLLAGSDDARVLSELATADPECFGLDGTTGTARAERLRALARSWVGRPVTWTVHGTHARGLVGPPMPAMPTVCMSLERGTWRFAGFVPGE